MISMQTYILIGTAALLSFIYVLGVLLLIGFVIKNSLQDKWVNNVKDIVLGTIVSFFWPLSALYILFDNIMTFLSTRIFKKL